jgi:hypothetical protein
MHYSAAQAALMFAQINHVAIISHQYNTLGKFYEAVFGLKFPARAARHRRSPSAMASVGLNLIPRRDGYVGASIISAWWSMTSNPCWSA